jgi:protein-tyrosine phosphatase
MTVALASAIVNPSRLWARAMRWLLVLAPFFFLSYGAANWLAAMRTDVGSVVFAWESRIPFVPWTIIPYWSIDLLYGISLFVCTSERELDTHARRLITAQVIAVTCFILFPLRFTFARPEADGFAGYLFASLDSFDKPFNQAPSLHIALLVILWDRFARHVSKWARLPLHAWFTLIGVSVLTTYQHHFFDVPTGALLGFVCLWLWPERGPSPVTLARLDGDPRRWALAACYAAGSAALAAIAAGIGGLMLWLFWPSISLAMVAANYAIFGAPGFQKGVDGQMSVAARWLLAPYIAAARINARLWTRNDPECIAIGDGVMLGRLPRRLQTSRYRSIVDLAAELPRPDGNATYSAFPMLDLIAPPSDRLRQVAETIERTRTIEPVLVCCALGYGRSAAAVATWLLITGRADSADDAIARLRAAGARVALSGSARAIAAAAELRP